MIYKILKNIIASITVISAIIYAVISAINSSIDTYQAMILSLLILISTTSILEGLDDERKWKEIKHTWNKDVSNIVNCRIQTFSDSVEWVAAMKELIKGGEHIIDTASLDSTTRSKAKPQHSVIWKYINDCCSDSRIQHRHIIRVRSNNFENLLDRITSGSANNNSYFACYSLSNNFSFPTFGIIDNKYISTRSPYQEGEVPCYMIIENAEMVSYFSNYYNDLWRNSYKIDNVDILYKIYDKLKENYSSKTQESIEAKLKKIKERGVIDDI